MNRYKVRLGNSRAAKLVLLALGDETAQYRHQTPTAWRNRKRRDAQSRAEQDAVELVASRDSSTPGPSAATSPHPPTPGTSAATSPHPPTPGTSAATRPHPPTPGTSAATSHHPPTPGTSAATRPHPPTPGTSAATSPHPPTPGTSAATRPHPPTPGTSAATSPHPPTPGTSAATSPHPPTLGTSAATSPHPLTPGASAATSPQSPSQVTSSKRHYCTMCCMLKSRMARHLSRKHKYDRRVQACMTQTGRERSRAFKQIIVEMDHHYNLDNQNNIIAVRQKAKANNEEYSACQHCGGSYVTRNMWKHRRLCHKQHGSSRKKILLNQTFGRGEVLKLVSRLRHAARQVVATDEVLLMCAERFLAKYESKQELDYVRGRLRRMANFLMTYRKLFKNDINMYEVISVKNYNKIKRATEQISKTFSSPSVALRVGEDLELCRRVSYTIALTQNDKDRQEELKNVEFLLKDEYKETIRVRARKVLREIKRHKIEKLPLQSDILKMKEFLVQLLESLQGQLAVEWTRQLWTKLAKATLTRVVFYNRRRSGEVGRILLKDFEKALAQTEVDQETSIEMVEEHERDVFNSLLVVRSVGKRGSIVPTVFSKEVKQATDTLISTRQLCGIHPDNPYLFARPFSLTNISGSDAVRELVGQFARQLKKPHLLRSTLLRKALATQIQAMNLTETDRLKVSDHCGHSVTVHDAFYRLKTKANEFEVSKLLTAIEGSSSDLRGKSLRDLRIVTEKPSYSKTEQLPRRIPTLRPRGASRHVKMTPELFGGTSKSVE